MKKVFFVVCCALGILAIGCQRAEKPAGSTGKTPAPIAEPESAPDAEVMEP